MEGDNVHWADVVKNLDPTQFKRVHKSIHEYDVAGHTALYSACYHYRPNWVRYLIDSKCDVNQRTQRGKDTPLIVSFRYPYDTSIFKMLLEAKADVNTENDHGRTPLCQALTFWGTLDIVDLLLKHGADVNFKNPLDVVVHHDVDKASAKRLILLGAQCSSFIYKKNMPMDLQCFTKCLANCKVATRCVERLVIKRYGKQHKDIVSIIVSFIWKTKEDKKWLL